MATFITSKGIGEEITISVLTSAEYWKYYHDGTYSSVINGGHIITVANANGEFTLIPCDDQGNVSGDINFIYLDDNQLTSFDGTGLSGLTNLTLYNNQLTSFTGTGLSSLTELGLGGNPLVSFNGGDMGQITYLGFQDWGISTLTSFDGTGLSGLTGLSLNGNPLTSFYGGDMTQITSLNFPGDWSITTLETFDGGNMTGLTYLVLAGNQLTSFDGTNLTSLNTLNLENNPSINTTSINNSLLVQLAANELANAWGYGEFYTTGGRTSAGTTDYDYLIANNWVVDGADLVPTVTGKLRVKGVGQINP
jgi:hypothetical protein